MSGRGTSSEQPRGALTKPVLAALAGHRVGPPPVWLMRQAGRYLPEYRQLRRRSSDFLRFCYTPDLTVEATLQPLRRFAMDAAIVFSDILVVPDALGRAVTFVEEKGPVLEPVRQLQDLPTFDPEAFHARLQPVYEAIRRLSATLPASTTLIGFAGAPWTIALYMVEGRGGGNAETVRTWAAAEPVSFGRMIDLLVDVTAQYLERQIESGAEAVQLFDSWAGLLGEQQFRRWVIDPTVEVVSRLRRSRPEVPIIGFPRGAGVLYRDYVEATGVDGVSVDAAVPASWVRAELQHRCTVQGNLDPYVLLAGGEVLAAEIRRIVAVLGEGPFIFNLGHGILPQTPVDHVTAMVDQIRRSDR